MTSLAVYGGLFLAALLAATILPAQSEAALAAAIVAGREPVWALVAVASLGNVLGSVVNYALGYFLTRFENRRWFPLTRAQIAKAEGWYHRWGKWSLLLSWAPVVGDPLTLVAGVLRENLAVFVVLVTIAKVGRYLVIAWALA
ncbi:MAG: DedA family protein [Methylobacteriaceae bacterium]|nr:DedA family protein [Methylobacteriaceae bacterium]